MVEVKMLCPACKEWMINVSCEDPAQSKGIIKHEPCIGGCSYSWEHIEAMLKALRTKAAEA